MPPPRVSASSSRLLRRLNRARVLEAAWADETLTAAELMTRTGLARSTVLTLCRELVDQGWLRDEGSVPPLDQHGQGRPALRYAFCAQAGWVLALDAGQHRLRARLTDLHATPRLDVERVLDPASSAAERRRAVAELVEQLLGEAQPSSPPLVVLGVPAPVDRRGGGQAERNEFWAQMNPDLGGLLAGMGLTAVVENDANLAALAEMEPDGGSCDLAVLLAGERFGAGVVLDGELRRGRRGEVGELRVLDLVAGVASSDGLAAVTRQLIGPSGPSGLGGVGAAGDAVPAVLRAAEQGDPTGREVLEVMADRLARVTALLTGLLDLDRVVVSGALSTGLEPVLTRARQLLPEHLHQPTVELARSRHGADGVLVGAVRRGLAEIREHALRTVGPEPAHVPLRQAQSIS